MRRRRRSHAAGAGPTRRSPVASRSIASPALAALGPTLPVRRGNHAFRLRRRPQLRRGAPSMTDPAPSLPPTLEAAFARDPEVDPSSVRYYPDLVSTNDTAARAGRLRRARRVRRHRWTPDGRPGTAWVANGIRRRAPACIFPSSCGAAVAGRHVAGRGCRRRGNPRDDGSRRGREMAERPRGCAAQRQQLAKAGGDPDRDVPAPTPARAPS